MGRVKESAKVEEIWPIKTSEEPPKIRSRQTAANRRQLPPEPEDDGDELVLNEQGEKVYRKYLNI